MTGRYAAELAAQLALFERLAGLEPAVEAAADRLAACLSAGGTLWLCGNGASAATAQRLAAYLSGAGAGEGRPLAAVALCNDAAALSGGASARGFDRVLARQVSALGRAGDALWLVHAGGPADNLLNAARVARDAGLLTLGLLCGTDRALASLCHLGIVLPTDETLRVEAAQAFVGQVLCGLVEAALLPA